MTALSDAWDTAREAIGILDDPSIESAAHLIAEIGGGGTIGTIANAVPYVVEGIKFMKGLWSTKTTKLYVGAIPLAGSCVARWTDLNGVDHEEHCLCFTCKSWAVNSKSKHEANIEKYSKDPDSDDSYYWGMFVVRPQYYDGQHNKTMNGFERFFDFLLGGVSGKWAANAMWMTKVPQPKASTPRTKAWWEIQTWRNSHGVNLWWSDVDTPIVWIGDAAAKSDELDKHRDSWVCAYTSGIHVSDWSVLPMVTWPEIMHDIEGIWFFDEQKLHSDGLWRKILMKDLSFVAQALTGIASNWAPMVPTGLSSPAKDTVPPFVVTPDIIQAIAPGSGTVYTIESNTAPQIVYATDVAPSYEIAPTVETTTKSSGKALLPLLAIAATAYSTMK